MAATVDFGDEDVIKHLLAQHIMAGATGVTGITVDDLATAICEVTPQTKTDGPAQLQLELADPNWKILRSGLCDKDPVTGRPLQRIDINFPYSTPVFWRLSLCEFSNDFSQPNLTLTFTHRSAIYLQEDWGAFSAPSGQGAAATSGGTSPAGTMYDTTSSSPAETLPTQTPFAVAGYDDGRFQSFGPLTAAYPNAFQLSISTRADGATADFLDVENGDASPDQAGPWVQRMLGLGVWKPGIYAQQSNMAAVQASLATAGLQRNQYRLWVAHWNQPAVVPAGYDAIQYATVPAYDTSVVNAGFFNAATGATSSSSSSGLTGQAGVTTVAEFFQQLCDRIPTALDKSIVGPTIKTSGPSFIPSGKPGDATSIRFLCPELMLDETQFATSMQINTLFDTSGTTFIDASDANQGQSGPVSTASSTASVVQKAKGVAVGSGLTVKGQPISKTQARIASAALAAGEQLQAPTNALIACLYAGMGESSLGGDAGQQDNVWQANSPSAYGPSPNWTAMAVAFFQGTKDFQSGGAIQCAKNGDGVVAIANEVEANAKWIGAARGGSGPGGVNSYVEPGWSQAQGLAEAQAIVSAYGGGVLTASNGGAKSITQAYLTRGTSDNPDEDSWTCMNRLNSQLGWSLYTSPQEGGIWGNYVVFCDGPTLDTQLPAAIIELSDDGTVFDLIDPQTGRSMSASFGDSVVSALSGTLDNSVFNHAATGTSTQAGKSRRPPNIAGADTPTQLKFNMFAGVLQFVAGNTIKFQPAKSSSSPSVGPLDGVWIIADTTRNALMDDFDQFTLAPPTAPNPVPSDALSTSGTAGTALSLNGAQAGTLADVAAAAQEAVTQQAASNYTLYQYNSGSLRQNPSGKGNLLQGNPRTFDCSAFVTACYRAAGLPDPNKQNYNPYGNTSTLAANGQQIPQSQALPGDVVLYGQQPIGSGGSYHAAVYMGNGNVCSLGGAVKDPAIYPVADCAAGRPWYFYRMDVAMPGIGTPWSYSWSAGYSTTPPSSSSTPAPSSGVLGGVFSNPWAASYGPGYNGTAPAKTGSASSTPTPSSGPLQTGYGAGYNG